MPLLSPNLKKIISKWLFSFEKKLWIIILWDYIADKMMYYSGAFRFLVTFCH